MGVRFKERACHANATPMMAVMHWVIAREAPTILHVKGYSTLLSGPHPFLHFAILARGISISLVGDPPDSSSMHPLPC